MAREIFRYSVPVDDRWHTFELTGPVLHVAARETVQVELWVMHDPDAKPELRAFRVFGTGQPLPPAAATFVGTALIGPFAWHLLEHERPAPTP